MKKTLFILNPRAGSNLFLFLIGSNKIGCLIDHENQTLARYGSKYADLVNPYISQDNVHINDWSGTEESFWLSTKPGKICPCDNYYVRDPQTTLVTNPPIDQFSWYVHMGDWWGVTETHHQVPGPYDLETFSRFSHKELTALPGDDWKFIYMIRDGRNQIESLFNIPDGYEADRLKKDADDFFLVMCKGWRNRARLALDCQALLPNYKLFKFENFIKDPVNILGEMLTFAGLELNTDLVSKSYKYLNEQSYQSKHSSFAKNHDTNQRYHSWTDWQKEQFHDIAGKELIELGYETGYDW